LLILFNGPDLSDMNLYIMSTKMMRFSSLRIPYSEVFPKYFMINGIYHTLTFNIVIGL